MSEHLGRAWELYEEKSYAKARKACRAALKHTPGDDEALALSHVCLFHEEGAMRPLRKARKHVRERPESRHAWWAMAMILQADNKFTEARYAAQRWLECDPDNANPHYLIALTCLMESRYEDALEAAELGLEAHPDHESLQALRQESLAVLGRLDEMDEEPDEWDEKIAEGWRLLDEGQAREALMTFAEVLAENPYSYRAQNGHTETLMRHVPPYRWYIMIYRYCSSLIRNQTWIFGALAFGLVGVIRLIVNGEISPQGIAVAAGIYATLFFLPLLSEPLGSFGVLFHPLGRDALAPRQKILPVIVVAILVIGWVQVAWGMFIPAGVSGLCLVGLAIAQERLPDQMLRTAAAAALVASVASGIQHWILFGAR